MRNPQKVLNSLAKHGNASDYKYERLYRLLYNQEMYVMAYQKIYANEGNMTKGIDEKTIDGMSLERINNIISSLKDESYKAKPARRVYIPKKNGKMRPLGIPSFEDKLLQEVVSMILEAIYEGYFEDCSHGFRPNRSCHTALLEVRGTFKGTRWFIEGDIKGFFDNINHNTMINILNERIKDNKFLRLIRKFLNAGYVEKWTLNRTETGCPQGGCISPILANIYLDKLDKYIKDYIQEFDKGQKRKVSQEYRDVTNSRRRAERVLLKAVNESQRKEAIDRIKCIEKEKALTTRTEPIDENYRRLKYVRYCDDWICGVIGSKEDCEKIKADVTRYLNEKLQLELSEEKTLITNAQNKANFLSYSIYIRKSQECKRNKLGRLARSYSDGVVLEIPENKIKNLLLKYNAMEIVKHQGKELWIPMPQRNLISKSDLEIIEAYNSAIRGLYNYYSIAINSSGINNFKYIMQYSMFKTFASKYRTSKRKIIAKLRINKDFGVRYKNSKGEEKIRLFYNNGFKRKRLSGKVEPMVYDMDTQQANTASRNLRTTQCEICGKENASIVVHHVRKLKGLQGKTCWEQLMRKKRRKTLALCQECHKDIHCKKLD